MVSVTVYGKPDCIQCDYTERELRKIPDVTVNKIDITADEAARQVVVSSGKTQLPMVVAYRPHDSVPQTWHGFRPDMIKALKQVAA